MKGKLYPTVIKKATGSMARGGMSKHHLLQIWGYLNLLLLSMRLCQCTLIHIYNILTIKRIRLDLYENATKRYLAFCIELEFQVSVATSMVTLPGLVHILYMSYALTHYAMSERMHKRGA